MTPYERFVKNRTPDDLLRSAGDYVAGVQEGPTGQYMLVAAQILSTHELTNALKNASTDSGDLGKKILWLTGALVFVGVLQALAAAWPYLSWWARHL
jgi:hypothetical protein